MKTKSDAMVAFLARNKRSTWMEIAAAVGIASDEASGLLSNLCKRGRIRRVTRGVYEVCETYRRNAYDWEEVMALLLELWAKNHFMPVKPCELFELARSRGLHLTSQTTIGYMHLQRGLDKGVIVKVKGARYLPSHPASLCSYISCITLKYAKYITQLENEGLSIKVDYVDIRT